MALAIETLRKQSIQQVSNAETNGFSQHIGLGDEQRDEGVSRWLEANQRLLRAAVSRSSKGILDDDKKEDAMQEASINIWRHWDQFDPHRDRASREGWAYRIARNAAVDEIRRQISDSRRSLRFATHAREQALVNPEDIVVNGIAQRDLIQRALSVLSPEQQQTIFIKAASGLTDVEAAKMLGIPLGTYKTRVRSARQKVEENIAEKF